MARTGKRSGFVATPKEIAAIVACAECSSRENKERAINCFVEMLRRRPSIQEREDCLFRFMFEVDNEIPDLVLRAKYRKEVIAKYGGTA